MNGNIRIQGHFDENGGNERDMPYSCFSKEIRDYARACEHLIGESARGSNAFTEDELELVTYYTDEVFRLVTGKPTPVKFHNLRKEIDR